MQLAVTYPKSLGPVSELLAFSREPIDKGVWYRQKTISNCEFQIFGPSEFDGSKLKKRYEKLEEELKKIHLILSSSIPADVRAKHDARLKKLLIELENIKYILENK